jgi:hypothetical protein
MIHYFPTLRSSDLPVEEYEACHRLTLEFVEEVLPNITPAAYGLAAVPEIEAQARPLVQVEQATRS